MRRPRSIGSTSAARESPVILAESSFSAPLPGGALRNVRYGMGWMPTLPPSQLSRHQRRQAAAIQRLEDADLLERASTGGADRPRSARDPHAPGRPRPPPPRSAPGSGLAIWKTALPVLCAARTCAAVLLCAVDASIRSSVRTAEALGGRGGQLGAHGRFTHEDRTSNTDCRCHRRKLFTSMVPAETRMGTRSSRRRRSNAARRQPCSRREQKRRSCSEIRPRKACLRSGSSCRRL